MPKSNLLLASCRPGSGPINPLGLLSAFVLGMDHFSGGNGQFLEPYHSEDPEALSLHGNHSSLSLVMSDIEYQWCLVRSNSICMVDLIHMDDQCASSSCIS